MNLYFTSELRDCLDLLGRQMALKIYNEGVLFQMEIRKISCWRPRSTWSFDLVVLQRTEMKCTKTYNARLQLLFCSLNLLLSEVLVAVVVVVCLSSLKVKIEEE